VPEQPRSQRANLHPARGDALSRTSLRAGNRARQAGGQTIPLGLLLTVPPPLTATNSVFGRAVAAPYAIAAPTRTTRAITPIAVRRRSTPTRRR
jgi:hypothetical protein